MPLQGAITYKCDNAGNRLTKTQGGTTENYTYDNANKLLTAGSKSYSYDNAGNVTGVSGGGTNSTLAWDAESRLKSATVGTSTTTYSYWGHEIDPNDEYATSHPPARTFG